MTRKPRHNRFITILVCIFALTYADLYASAKEYQVKAAYLTHFLKFIQWPEPPPSSRSAAICIIGEDPFGSDLNELMKGERINGRPVEVKRVSRMEDTRACMILFVSQSERERVPSLVRFVRGKHAGDVGTLLVGDSPDFAEKGGAIQFITESGKIRFIVNLEAAEAAGLKISSRMLALAKVLRPR